MKTCGERGQVTIEYLLIAVVLFGIFLAVKNVVVGKNMLGNFVEKPWATVAGMIETGVWGDVKKVRPMHPGSLDRHNSFRGDVE